MISSPPSELWPAERTSGPPCEALPVSLRMDIFGFSSGPGSGDRGLWRERRRRVGESRNTKGSVEGENVFYGPEQNGLGARGERHLWGVLRWNGEETFVSSYKDNLGGLVGEGRQPLLVPLEHPFP